MSNLTSEHAVITITIISAYVRLYNFEIRVGEHDTNFAQNALCYYHPGVVGNGAMFDSTTRSILIHTASVSIRSNG